MSRDLEDRDESAEDQPQLAFAPGERRSAARREAEPPRAEFFRAQRRPILPIVGLVGAVATVAGFLWLGREEPQEGVAPEETPPVASAPAPDSPLPELPLHETPAPATAPSGGPIAAIEAPAVPAAPEAAEADPLAPNPSVLGPSAALPPVASAGQPAPKAAPMPAVAAAAAAAHPAAAPASAHRAPAAARGGYSVQLLAARSESQVGGAWQKLRGAHPDLLASLSPSVSATERAGSGTFYRLRVGPLHDRAAADALCRKLSARNQSCFVVSPGS